MRVLNATGQRAWVVDPMVDALRAWWCDEVDLSHYGDPAHSFDSLYYMRRIRDELGFVARVVP